MRAVMLEVPESLLEERRRSGADRRDEMWEGVLHMVPPPSGDHQRLSTRLAATLLPIAERKGMSVSCETGLFRASDDYRIPDIVVALSVQETRRGVEGGAELVIELLSPGDETHEKLPWYAAFPVREVLVLNPDTRAVELFALRDGRLQPVLPDADGRLRSEVLGVTSATRPGPRLEVTGPGGASTL